MAFSRCMSWTAVLCLFLSLCSLIQAASEIDYIQAVDEAGEAIYLDSNRRPALYTKDFGDCLGSSIINVTRFDVAYYKDNMTVLFHLQGNTDVRREGLMSTSWNFNSDIPYMLTSTLVFIGVYAYGEARFDLTFNPCNANIARYCSAHPLLPLPVAEL